MDEEKEYKEGGSERFEVSMVNWWLAGVLKVVPSGNYQTLKRWFGSVCVCLCWGWLCSFKMLVGFV